jgi:hypothetical protein
MMLRYSLVLVVGLTVGPMLTQARAAAWAHVLFDEVSKDFGSVPRGPLLEHRFRVVNRTNATVNISSIKVACGCTKATTDKMTLKPGEETVLYVTMDTTRFTGTKSVTIFVNFDQPQADEVRLVVQAYGRNDFTVSPDTLTFGQVKRGNEVAVSAAVTFHGLNGAKITNVRGESNYLVPTVTEKSRSDHEVVYELTTKLRNDTPVGKWYTDVWVETNVQTLPKIRVPLTVEVESPLTVSPSYVTIGEVRKGDESVRRVIVRGVKPFKITAIHGSDPTVEVSPPPAEEREVHVITVKVKPLNAGPMDRTLRVITDLKEDREIDFKVTADVRD